MRIYTVLCTILSPLTLATHLRVAISPSNLLPNPAVLPPSTSASLTTLSFVRRSPLRVDNTFDFRNATSGSYLFEIHCHTHAFAPLRVDVHDGEIKEVEAWGTFRGNEWANKGEVAAVRKTQEEGSDIWAFEVKVGAQREYFLERAGFSPVSLLKNPMILIAGVSMIIVFGMPYLMENMDPEMRAEFEERQKASPLTGGQAANPLQNFDAAAWLAGSSSSTPKRSATPVDKGVTR